MKTKARTSPGAQMWGGAIVGIALMIDTVGKALEWAGSWAEAARTVWVLFRVFGSK